MFSCLVFTHGFLVKVFIVVVVADDDSQSLS